MGKEEYEELVKDCEEMKRLLESATRTEVRKVMMDAIAGMEKRMSVLTVSLNKDLQYTTLARYAWYEEAGYVKVTCDLENLKDADDVICDFQTESFCFSAVGVPDKTGKKHNYRLGVTQLHSDVKPSSCVLTKKDNKFGIKLVKQERGEEWKSLDRSEKVKQGQHKSLADSGASTEELLQNLYKNADDKTRADLSRAAFEGRLKREAEAK
eukprot:TRINITY_DN2473_c1_g2_i1.p1 TRINITY_DN2473_c1_g2~~TRINITY_DN2473_c1_g2_i1.p1  ORF type:complete len:210 (+),score=74.62 TRINITY_DN2473_c1_g2_i1:48-677(+)